MEPYKHTYTCVFARINLRVVSDPLRAALALFAYTANTASWYSVRELRCCNTTEDSLPTTTACRGAGGSVGEVREYERWKRRCEELEGIEWHEKW